MLVIDAERTRAALPFPALIAALRDAFIAGAEVPLRHSHRLQADATLLLMPAWRGRSALGVKIVTVFPDNGRLGLNAVASTYLLCDGATGQHLALIDGNELTGRRTAAASALAGTFLARADAATLLIVGAGHIAAMLAPACWCGTCTRNVRNCWPRRWPGRGSPRRRRPTCKRRRGRPTSSVAPRWPPRR
jgi:ornithine cyclodeaminase